MELNHGLLRNQPLGELKNFIIDVSAVYWSVSRAEQQIRHLTTAQVRTMFRMEISMKDLLSVRWLRWLGHMARMSDNKIGWLPTQPAHGAKLRWSDKVRQDIKRFSIPGKIS